MTKSRITKLIGSIGIIAIAVVLFSSTSANANDQRVRLASAAHQLDGAVDHFHHSIEGRAAFSHIAKDAHSLAKLASHFHTSVDRGTSVHHLARDLAKINSRLWHLKHQLSHSHSVHHNGHVLRELRTVELALRRVSYELTGPRTVPHDHHHDTGHIRIGPFVLHR